MGRRRGSPLPLAALALVGCIELSPHELPTSEADRDVHRKNVERLAAAPAGEPLRFVVLGDTQRYFDHAADFVAAVNARDDVELVLQAGDFTNFGRTFEYEVMNRVFRGLRVPYFVAAGNHDLIGNGQAVYEHVFGPLDFAFTHGRTRFVLLNTNGLEFSFAPDVPDLAWLAEQLAPDDDHDRAVVLAHADTNAQEFRDDLREPFRALLRDAGVAIAMYGHGHVFAFDALGTPPSLLADAVNHRNFVVVTLGPGAAVVVERVFF